MPYFAVYAPDYTDEGALERRLKVRETHLAAAGKGTVVKLKIGGAMLSPNEALDTPDAERKMVGSIMIFEAGSYAEVKARIEDDVYWTGNVWDKEKTVITPWVSAHPL